MAGKRKSRGASDSSSPNGMGGSSHQDNPSRLRPRLTGREVIQSATRCLRAWRPGLIAVSFALGTFVLPEGASCQYGGTKPPYATVTLFSENNSPAGSFSPGHPMSWCATVSAGVPAQVLVGATINFTLLNPVGAPINLSTNSAVTNSCGQAIVIASGSAQGVATLQASWTGPDGTVYTQAGDAYCLTAT
ncbi:MAG: hypothetical protein KGK12_13505, partial [Armatimonadetes bacterium]|nr:hypothetical protein [Armatimonadota bacterium]